LGYDQKEEDLTRHRIADPTPRGKITKGERRDLRIFFRKSCQRESNAIERQTPAN